MKDIYSLAIETSCDETSVAILKNSREILSNVVYSQIEIHKKYGGVVPEIASRNHVLDINQCVDEAIERANISLKDLDFISVTCGPGLIGALLVGVSYGKALAYALNIPLVGVHHILGHIAANYIHYPDLEPPFICLVVSGGHTHIIMVEDYTKCKVLGMTQDDAAGEAFDKVARCLDLPYPGGPNIEKLAKDGDIHAIKFPKAVMKENSLDFSFSGIKSSVLNYVNSCKMKNQDYNKADIAASFQNTVVEILCEKIVEAAKKNNMNKIAIAGGVSANNYLKESLMKAANENNLEFYCPKLNLSTDNAAMIAVAGYYLYKDGKISDLTLNPRAVIDIETI